MEINKCSYFRYAYRGLSFFFFSLGFLVLWVLWPSGDSKSWTLILPGVSASASAGGGGPDGSGGPAGTVGCGAGGPSHPGGGAAVLGALRPANAGAPAAADLSSLLDEVEAPRAEGGVSRPEETGRG